ncbi:MAG: monovalent cation/H(+) antiporter subunit G [Acidimicrobiales bacterium]|nr:monovalent cation/H(+) antiporter subunit G [Acidimicrobiales bacterium]
MNAAMDAAGQLLILLGAMLTLLAGIGVVRFGDALARMHALTKASTLGVVLVLVGAGVVLDNVNDRTSLLLAALTQLLTAPVGANLIGPTTYAAAGIPTVLSGPDELAEDHRPGA